MERRKAEAFVAIDLSDDMVKFLIELCRHNDKLWNGMKRKSKVNKFYKRARKFIKRAGYEYEEV